MTQEQFTTIRDILSSVVWSLIVIKFTLIVWFCDYVWYRRCLNGEKAR